jgi:Cu+-exporting ATPase
MMKRTLVMMACLALVLVAAGCGKDSEKGNDHSGHDHATHQDASTTDTSKMEMVSCPVMGTKFAKDKAVNSTEYKGKTYYFCCLGCKSKFVAEPEKYVKK